MKQSQETIYDRTQWLLLNNFVYNTKYEYQHKSECIMIKTDLIDNASNEEWNRLVDSIEYFLSMQSFNSL